MRNAFKRVTKKKQRDLEMSRGFLRLVHRVAHIRWASCLAEHHIRHMAKIKLFNVFGDVSLFKTVSEMFCVRCELEPDTCDKISNKREQLPGTTVYRKRSKGWDSRSRPPRNPCTACPFGAQLPFACPPQMRWGFSSRSRKGSVGVSLQQKQ